MIYYRFCLYKHTPNGRRENDTDELCIVPRSELGRILI